MSLRPPLNCSCLAHVINLGTQLLISTYSQSPHYDPKNPNAALAAETSIFVSRDGIGLIRAISVKVRTINIAYYLVFELSMTTGVLVG